MLLPAATGAAAAGDGPGPGRLAARRVRVRVRGGRLGWDERGPPEPVPDRLRPRPKHSDPAPSERGGGVERRPRGWAGDWCVGGKRAWREERVRERGKVRCSSRRHVDARPRWRVFARLGEFSMKDAACGKVSKVGECEEVGMLCASLRARESEGSPLRRRRRVARFPPISARRPPPTPARAHKTKNLLSFRFKTTPQQPWRTTTTSPASSALPAPPRRWCSAVSPAGVRERAREAAGQRQPLCATTARGSPCALSPVAAPDALRRGLGRSSTDAQACVVASRRACAWRRGSRACKRGLFSLALAVSLSAKPLLRARATSRANPGQDLLTPAGPSSHPRSPAPLPPTQRSPSPQNKTKAWAPPMARPSRASASRRWAS